MQGSGGYIKRIRRLYIKDQEGIRQGSGGYTTMISRLLAVFFGIGATIHIHQEMLCLLYAGFFLVHPLSIQIFKSQDWFKSYGNVT